MDNNNIEYYILGMLIILAVFNITVLLKMVVAGKVIIIILISYPNCNCNEFN